MVTQQDIADRLNVSRPLVSLVLNGKLGPKHARPEVVTAIKKAAKEMGYYPNLSALAFISGKHQTLGVFLRQVGTPGSGVFYETITGISDQADQYNQKLWLKMYREDEDLAQMLEDVNPGVIDGLIVSGRYVPEAAVKLREFQDRGLPILFLAKPPNQKFLIGIEDVQKQVSQMATSHLIEQGCKRIVHFDSQRRRTEGYLAALKDGGIRVNKSLIRSVKDYSGESGKQVIRQLLSEGVRFDGISAQSDEQAIEAMNVLLSAGVKIPDEVKIIGIDDSPYCKLLPIKLSSVYKREEEKGRLGVRMLMDMIEGKKVKSVSIPPVLKVRQSTLK